MSESVNQKARMIVRELVEGIAPLDDTERSHRGEALAWIDSGAELFRTARPATPDPHLCAYAVLVDDVRRSVLLADHVKAGCWLFPGGHVDPLEDPRETVLREAAEELSIDPVFHPRFGDDPFFLSVTKTRGQHSHTDVTFWGILAGSEDMALVADPREAHELRWFSLDDPSEWADADRFDPATMRFLDKLTAHLAAAPVS